MVKPGDKVRIITKDGEHTGLLMPNEDKQTVVLKLTSGYNIGIKKTKITKTQILKKAEQKKNNKKKEPVFDKKKPTIAILHTGGTIASKVDYESGGVTAKFSAADLVSMVPELGKIANIKTELVANMMSEDMNLSDHKKIAKAVNKYHNNVDGIIIGHGTDTLGYTAAMLSFMLENVKIPVLLVGSQRSSDRGSSDAVSNLIAAAKFITNSNFFGVATCLHYTSSDDKMAIISGTNARKLHTSRRDAFKAVNTKPYALVDYKTGKIEKLKDYPKNTDKFIIRDKYSDKVAFVKTHPNIGADVFKFYTKNYDAIVIEGTGLGHAPTNTPENQENLKILKDYIKNGGIIAMTSQCIFGRVHPFVYTNLRRLSELGVVYCEDMLPETAFVKLSWLLGNYSKEKVPEMMTMNLRGEINKRHMQDDFLI